MNKESYPIKIIWTGNKGVGTKDNLSYERSFSLVSEGKSDISGTADPAFKGDPKKWNPEELLLAALASCHMLSYLYLCSAQKIIVTEYQDEPIKKMKIEPSGKGYFESATLHPVVKIADSEKINLAKELHHRAHEICFIANSVNFSVSVEPTVMTKD